MEFCQLGSLRLPAVRMGAWKTCDLDERVAHQVTFVDSCRVYGKAENAIGPDILGGKA